MKLITETNTNVIVEESEAKDLYITGVFSSYGVRNKNGREYTQAILEREVDKLMPDVKSKCLYGELNHPPRPDVDLHNAAILIESLDWQGKDLFGRAVVLETQVGNTLRALMKRGKVGISSRGLGTVNENGLVNEDFNLICWDIVASASNPASKFVNGIYEGVEFEIPGIKKSEVPIVPQIDEEAEAKKYFEAQQQYKKHVWQVLENMIKSI